MTGGNESERRIGRCILDLITFAAESKVPEGEFLEAITRILIIKLASMPRRERRRMLEDIGESVEFLAERASRLPADWKELLKRVGWVFEGE